MYLRGTVGNICFIADTKSVNITSAFCMKEKNKMENYLNNGNEK